MATDRASASVGQLCVRQDDDLLHLSYCFGTGVSKTKTMAISPVELIAIARLTLRVLSTVATVPPITLYYPI